MSAVPRDPLPFPVAEGVGIFIGIVAWNVLTAGELELLRAPLIAAGGALVWYGARRWLSGKNDRTPRA